MENCFHLWPNEWILNKDCAKERKEGKKEKDLHVEKETTEKKRPISADWWNFGQRGVEREAESNAKKL